MKSEVLNYQQASDLLGIPIGSLYSLVSRRQIPHFRYGARNVRFSRAELESWKGERHVPETGSPDHQEEKRHARK